MLGVHSFRPAVAIAFAVLIAVSACAPRSSGPSVGTSGAPAPEPSPVPPSAVKVALIVPSGSSDPGVASLARMIANAGRMADADTPGPMQLQIYETTGDPTTSLAAARRALSDGAGLILGPLFAENTRVVGQAVAPTGVNVISFSTDSTIAGGPVYVSGFLPENEVIRVMDFARRQGVGTVAVFHPQTPFGDATLRAAREASRDLSMPIVASRSYPRSFEGIQDTSEPFAVAALGAGAESILLPEGGKGLQAVGAFMNYHSLSPKRVQYLGVGQWNSPATLGEVSLKGGWFASPDPVAVDAFLSRYASRYGATPEMLAVLGYDAVKAAAILARDAGGQYGDSRFGAQAITQPEGFQGGVGPFRFWPDGRSERALAIMQVGEEGFELIEPAPRRFGPGA